MARDSLRAHPQSLRLGKHHTAWLDEEGKSESLETRLFEESLYLLSRLVHLNPRAKKAVTENPKLQGIPYMLVYYLVSEFYAKEPRRRLIDIAVTFLMDITSDFSAGVALNTPLAESILISQLPVIAGSSVDLIVVAVCHLLDDCPLVESYSMNLLAVLKNMYIWR